MVLNVSGLNKSFKGNKVLKDISFKLNKGEILVILGQSGAGKTTLLRCINGLEKCDSGSIEIDGMYLCKDINEKSVYSSNQEMRSIRKKLGMVFQNFNLFPHMSVLENIIEAPVNAFNISRDEANKNAMKLLKIIGLLDKVSAYPFELSGGQKQRVAIARACALNPQIMCFDEPTSALDPELREGVANVIENLAKDNIAILIITHDMSFAKRVADRIIFMDKGEIIVEQDKKEFFENPKEDKARRFVFNG